MNWPYKNYPEHNFDETDYFKTHADKFKTLSNFLLERKQAKILDIGAGTGTVYSLLPSLEGFDIHALEIVKNFVDTLEERGIHAHAFDLDKGDPFPFEDEAFDVVMCDSMLEHTLRPRYLLEESRRVLKKGGTFVLVVPNATSIRRRWEQLRGRNIFYTLIDNLFTRTYLQRCAIFYSQEDIKKYIGKDIFKIEKISFLDESHHDAKSLLQKLFRVISFQVTPLRDVILVFCTKNKLEKIVKTGEM